MTLNRYSRVLAINNLRVQPCVSLRAYATHNTLGGASGSSRKQVTVVNDDGRVNWGDLSTREKAARTTQKTFHMGVILTGLVMTVRATREWLNASTNDSRGELRTCSIQRCLLRIVELEFSIGRWTRLEQAHVLQKSSDLVTRSEHSGNLRGTDGQEQDLLREWGPASRNALLKRRCVDQAFAQTVVAETTS